MSSIIYIKGDATAPVGDGLKIIAHVCNDIGAWGRGFVLAISRRWSRPENLYRSLFEQREKPQLGSVAFVPVEDNIVIANMIAQRGIRDKRNPHPLQYDALDTALSRVADYAISLSETFNVSVHMPRIGTGLAGGEWSFIEPLIVESIVQKGISVSIYDL